MAGAEALFTELNAAVNDAEYENVVSTCDKILAVLPQDIDALKCKCFALINLSEWKLALDMFSKYNELMSELEVEYPYAVYRSGDIDKAASLIKKFKGEKPVGLKYLEAQLAYRVGDYDVATKLYSDILAEAEEDGADVKTNLTAAMVANKKSGDALAKLQEDAESLRSSFELSYNAACALIDMGDFSAARKQLEMAMVLCRESLEEEDAEEDEIDDELAVMRVQAAYIDQLEGNEETAMDVYNKVMKDKPSDETVSIVAGNNIVALKKEKNLFDSLKKSKLSTSSAVEQKMTTHQKQTLAFNRALLFLHMGKFDQCRELINTLASQYPKSETPVLIQAALLHKEKKFTKCEDTLTNYAKSNPDQGLRVALTLAQIQLMQNNTKEAIRSLEQITSLQNKPGMVATLVKLHEDVKDVKSAVAVFDRAIAAAGTPASPKKGAKKGKSSGALKELLTHAAEFKVKHKMYKEAAETFEQLLKLDKKNVKALTGAIIAYSHFDTAKAEKLGSQLPPLALDSVDAETLEAEAAPRADRQARLKEEYGDSMGKKRGLEGEIEKKKRKKKKIRLPKVHDPNVAPDPERWLPKRERSYYKKSKRQRNQIRGAQGDTGGSTKNLDYSNRPMPAAPEPTPPVAAGRRKKKK